MERRGDEVHISTDEARGGNSPNIVRYMLFFGLLLAVAALSFIWITGAINTPDNNGGIADSERAAKQLPD
jgi:hypothetical protein